MQQAQECMEVAVDGERATAVLYIINQKDKAFTTPII